MLTETQKQQVRIFLGYPSAWRFRHSRLESLLTDIQPEAEVQILDLITNLAAIDAKLLSIALTASGIKKVDEIEFFPSSGAGSTRTELQRVGRQYVSRLSILLGVPAYGDFFGTSGYPGDFFMEGNRGNPIKLG